MYWITAAAEVIGAIPVVQGPSEPGPTSLFNVGWLTLPGIGIWVIIAGIIGRAIYRLIADRPAMKRIELDADIALRASLLKRVGDLEAAQKTIADQHFEALRLMAADHAAAAILQRAECAAEILLLRREIEVLRAEQARGRPAPTLAAA